MSRCRRWRSSTVALSGWQWSLAPSGRTPITALRRSARSLRTSAASRWTATCARTSLNPLAWPPATCCAPIESKCGLRRGYTLGPKGAQALTDRQGVTAAAGSIYSTPRDMARYLTALLGGGSGEGRVILKPETPYHDVPAALPARSTDTRDGSGVLARRP